MSKTAPALTTAPASKGLSTSRPTEMWPEGKSDLTHDLVLPAILFMALGAMTWAVRGSSGFGAFNGCVFAGVTWGTAWWFISRDLAPLQSRRYSSGWIILALTIGIGISGNRGWMQWPSFFEGHLQLNTAEGKFAPIPRIYGFLWLFIAGVPWAGLGACLLAWCGPMRPLQRRDWVVRLCCGLGASWLARVLFDLYPEMFLPLFETLRAQYADLQSNPNLRRLIGDNRAALTHLGLYLGFLGYEASRRDWKNVTLICTVGLVNGAGWAICQNWKWAPNLWPQVNFNWWRCWESCGGISIGFAYGLAYYLVNRPGSATPAMRQSFADRKPNLERFGAYLGLLLGLGLSIKNGLKGWANIYLGNEEHWNRVLWTIIGPAMVLCLAGLIVWIWKRPVETHADTFPKDYQAVWLILIIQNVIAQLVTGPYTIWNEMAFKIYYVLLMITSATIFHHFAHFREEEREEQRRLERNP
jgi:hypothetical protein